MKIIMINGSPRTKGATGQILSLVRECLEEMNPNVDIEYVNLGEINLLFCNGCASCYRTGVCHITEDGIEALSQKIESCDGVVFGSPTYASNVSAQFKVLIDRGHFIFEQLLKNKSCFSVVTYENYGGRKALKILNELIRYSGGAVSCNYRLKTDHNSILLDESRKKRIKNLCYKFLAKTKKKNIKSLYDKIMGSIAFRVVIKPHVLKNQSQYQGVISRWIRQGIISERR